MTEKRTGERYLVCAIHPWNRTLFAQRTRKLTGQWHLLDRPEQLTAALLKKFRPRYVFFLHWAWRVPKEILDAAECINFHMTDLPYDVAAAHCTRIPQMKR